MKVHFYTSSDNFEKLNKLINATIIDEPESHEKIFIYHGIPKSIVWLYRNKYFNVSISLEEYFKIQDYLVYQISDII